MTPELLISTSILPNVSIALFNERFHVLSPGHIGGETGGLAARALDRVNGRIEFVLATHLDSGG